MSWGNFFWGGGLAFGVKSTNKKLFLGENSSTWGGRLGGVLLRYRPAAPGWGHYPELSILSAMLLESPQIPPSCLLLRHHSAPSTSPTAAALLVRGGFIARLPHYRKESLFTQTLFFCPPFWSCLCFYMRKRENQDRFFVNLTLLNLLQIDLCGFSVKNWN